MADGTVAITGIGALCSLGEDCGTLWASVEQGRCGIGSIRRFATDGFSTHTGATVPAYLDSALADRAATAQLCKVFAETAGRECLVHARLEPGAVEAHRIGFVFGTGLGDLDRPIHLLAEEVADTLGALGPRLTVSTACSSSTGALGVATDLLALDAADVVIAGGADVLTAEVFAGFHALGVLSTGRCAPFSYPVGTSLGEGAGFLALERPETAARRGIIPLAGLSGYGLSGDAWHETAPHPKGSGIERAIRAALADADLGPGDIDYVNLHGSGTEANDPAEWHGVQRALGARAEEIPVSSTKGALGHAQGAAGILEAIVTILAMRRGMIPPTLNFIGARPHAPPDPVGSEAPRPCAVRHAISVNAAFGGANAAVVISRERRPRSRPRPEPIHVIGMGLVGPWGLGSAAFNYSEGGLNPSGVPVPPFAIEDLVPAVDPRGLDTTARYLTAAAALGLEEAGIVVRGPLRDRIGLIVGQLRASPSNMQDLERSIRERGLRHISAVAFARIVLNAAVGACSKFLSLRGPLTAITAGNASGVAAVTLAAEILSYRPDVEVLVAGGVDERSEAGPYSVLHDGAICVVLGKGGTMPPGDGGRSVVLAGWGLAGPGDLDSAVARAMARRPGKPDLAVRFIAPDDPPGRIPISATAGLQALASAVLTVRRGAARSVLVTVDAGQSLTTALLLTDS